MDAEAVGRVVAESLALKPRFFAERTARGAGGRPGQGGPDRRAPRDARAHGGPPHRRPALLHRAGPGGARDGGAPALPDRRGRGLPGMTDRPLFRPLDLARVRTYPLA